jgi:hypothetical protein
MAFGASIMHLRETRDFHDISDALGNELQL